MELSLLKKSRLFQGMNEREIVQALGCLGARERRYDKGNSCCPPAARRVKRGCCSPAAP